MKPVCCCIQHISWALQTINKTLDFDMIPIMIGGVIFTTTVGLRGFWDEQQRVTKLQDKKPVLKSLANSIP